MQDEVKVTQVLKACPFDGGVAVLQDDEDFEVGGRWVTCEGCGAARWGETADETIAEWNTRSTVAEEALRDCLQDIESRCPVFADKDDGPDDIAVEVELTWGDLHKIRAALSAAGGGNGE